MYLFHGDGCPHCKHAFKFFEEIEEMLHDYLIPAITRFHVCVKDLSNRNDIDKIANKNLNDWTIDRLGKIDGAIFFMLIPP